MNKFNGIWAKDTSAFNQSILNIWKNKIAEKMKK